MYRETRGYTPLPLIHEVPEGYAAQLFRSGYGRYVVELQTPSGQFVGSGLTDYLALRNALRRSEQAERMAA